MASQYQLVMRSGPTPGAAFSLEGQQINVGRDSTNEIVINDAEISRRHARLTLQGAQYVLEDVGSTNGTFINGQRLTGPRALKPGDVVSFGEQIMMIFEATSFDVGATVASPRASAVPSAPRPMMPPPPPPTEYVGSVPVSPNTLPPATVWDRNRTVIIIIAVAVFLFLCMCIAFFWWVDANFLWCTFFPFLGGC